MSSMAVGTQQPNTNLPTSNQNQQFVSGQTCFGFANSSGFECVHQLGTCVAENSCFFNPSTFIFGMGRNTHSQLGFPASNFTDYPMKASGTFNRIFYISKMASDESLLTDYNGVLTVSNAVNQQFQPVQEAITTPFGNTHAPIAILGDDDTTAFITTTNLMFVSGLQRDNSLGLERADDTITVPTQLPFVNVVDASISKMGGCAIHSTDGGITFNITFWGPAARVINGQSFSNITIVAISPFGAPAAKCEVISAKNSTGGDVPAILLLDTAGNLFSAGARSYLDGFDQFLPPNRTQPCLYGDCLVGDVGRIATNVDSFKCAATHCVAILNGGKQIFGWGNNDNFQLGATKQVFYQPTHIFTFNGNETAIQVTATKKNIYVLTESGYIHGMGSNERGQLGRSPSVFAFRTNLHKIVIPDQRRKVWHMADGPNSEYLLAFSGFKCSPSYSGSDCSVPNFSCNSIQPQNPLVCSGNGTCADSEHCICNAGFTGQYCNQTMSMYTCNGKSGPTACSQRGSCIAADTCSCFSSAFNGAECEAFKPDFTFVAAFTELPIGSNNVFTDAFNETVIIKPFLNISNPIYSDIYGFIAQSESNLYLTGPGPTYLKTNELIFDKNFISGLKQPGYYTLKVESVVNVTNQIHVVNNTFIFERRASSQTNALTLDQTGVVYVSKNAPIVISALITDPTFDSSTFQYDWFYNTDQQQPSYMSIKGKTSFVSNKITLNVAANELLPPNFTGTNFTIDFKVKYYRYFGDSDPFTVHLNVIINTKQYAPTITLNRFPLLNSYLSLSRATSLSAVLTFTESIPSDLEITYLWTCSGAPNLLLSPSNTQSAIVLYPSQLTVDTLYQFTLTTTISYKGDVSNYVSTLDIRTPPSLPSYSGGTTILSISPSDGSGVALLTAHNITVAPLPLSDNRLVKYFVRYSLNGSDTSSFKDLLSLTNNNFMDSAYLPYGSLTLQVYIEDEYGNKMSAGNLAVSTQSIDLNSLVGLVNSRNLSLNQIETTATTLNSIVDGDTKSIRERLSEILVSRLDSQSSSSTGSSQAILSLSQKSSDITPRTSQLLISGVSTLGANLRSMYASGVEADKVAGSLTSSLSNIVDNRNISTNETNKQITNSLSSISRELAKILLPSQTLSVTSNNFNILVFGSSSTKSTNYTLEGSSISTPDNFDEYLSGMTSSLNSASKAYGVELVYYKSSLFESVGKASDVKRASNVLSFVISASTSFGSESRSTVSIKGLSKPLVFTFSVVNATPNFDCKFIDEINNYWSNDGCNSTTLDPNTIQCSCNHATKFSTFRLFTQSVSRDEYLGNTGIRIVNIIFGAIYFLLAGLVFIALIVLRNINPVRSRYIGPYVGLIAIMIDSLVISFIQSIVVLTVDKGMQNTVADIANIRRISDGFNYFNAILVIPLYLTAFFTFLVQIVRYFIKRHMYEFISNKILYNAQIYRAITSKLAFWITLLISLSVIIAYYTIWVGLGGANVFVTSQQTSQQERERMTFTYITSLSYFGLAWIIAICMVVIACWDLFYMNRHLFTTTCCSSHEEILKKSSNKMKNNNGGNSRVDKLLNVLSRTRKQKVQLGKSSWLTIPQVYYFTDDNLYFRLEIHVFIIAFIFLTINYLAGIADITVVSLGMIDAGARLGPQIVSLVAGILFTLCLIAAFGGVIVVSHLTEKHRKKSKEVIPQSKMDEDELNVLLGDRFGKPLFVEFCQKEFSLENVYFYDAIIDFQRHDTRSDADVKNSLSEMYEKYIKTGSEYEVNLPSSSKKAYISTFENQQATSKMIKEMFDNVMISVMYNLKDTHSRFSMTEEYKLYQQSRDNISMLENNFL